MTETCKWVKRLETNTTICVLLSLYLIVNLFKQTKKRREHYVFLTYIRYFIINILDELYFRYIPYYLNVAICYDKQKQVIMKYWYSENDKKKCAHQWHWCGIGQYRTRFWWWILPLTIEARFIWIQYRGCQSIHSDYWRWKWSNSNPKHRSSSYKRDYAIINILSTHIISQKLFLIECMRNHRIIW